jgi:hypothetical protein
VEQADALGMLGRRDRAEATRGRLRWAEWAGPVPPRTPLARPSTSLPADKSHRGTLLALLGVATLIAGGIVLDPAAGWVAFGFPALFVVMLACLAGEGRWHSERDEGGRRGGRA